MKNLPALKDAILEVSGPVALLSFNRDDVRNALTGTALVEDIVQAVAWVNASPAISVLILTGNGAAFSAGGNIKQMQAREGIFAGSALAIEENYRHGIQRLTLAMAAAEVPLIAAVNGAAVGAGFDLACMCDLRLASHGAVCGETFINLGIIPGDGGAWYLQRLVGYQRAAELTLTGRMIGAEEAFALGLFLELCDPDALLSRARELAATIAAKPPQAVRLAKRLLGLARNHDLPATLAFSAAFQGMLHQSDDHLEAVNAFLEKRPGRFSGR
ncbi:enoyl-CoA hydratase-related protein [Desulfuromonas carbonis]|uniref:enoyl-CoA hydratase-related protein n=1 Tax=Desulfuromonas sp. DDH964 TaxID=1823759 RepID=UPI00078C1BDE|nr:enoyl-CoA hydratase-related protein [Desulfuromonas sp. DDH964]AMV70442.1 enoyl-CoA hydratase/isomerase [Desulfuromonas sp. DDH964]